ncbi:hypothetical protein [Flavobacterium lacisediminis]|uniref:Uncharacterized protein n=1 Tax=Flavobacterium lacisediminis TaxID=2989705 RepID=A0ABT3EJS1_9FLAO|nr:hypothetical protein [Flavobacterium lacisediminis]MCW1148817.1 hypothetical protein [Flavobacterium lacisediminis]
MNRTIFTVLMLITNLVIYSQVGIETTSIHTDAILDFPTGQNKGIVLPMVEVLPTGVAASNGTFLIDKTDGRVKVRQNGIWLNLTGTSSLSSYSVNPSADTFDGVIIGATSSSASGVLVLESTNKALMLPKVVSPHINIKSPYPGLMCYDTTKNAIAVFNGTAWYYWN